MQQITDFNLRDKKLLVIAYIYCIPDFHFRWLRFVQGTITDVIREEVEKNLPNTEGRFVRIGRLDRYGLGYDASSLPISVHVTWKVSPLWWTDHPQWYEGLSCHTLDEFPGLAPIIPFDAFEGKTA